MVTAGGEKTISEVHSLDEEPGSLKACLENSASGFDGWLFLI